MTYKVCELLKLRITIMIRPLVSKICSYLIVIFEDLIPLVQPCSTRFILYSIVNTVAIYISILFGRWYFIYFRYKPITPIAYSCYT